MDLSEKVADELYNVLPIVHKKLVGSMSRGLEIELTHYHLSILGMLRKNEPISISEIGNRLLISKPQMSAIIDKLITQELVSRKTDTLDRRIIHIYITEKGRTELIKAEIRIKKNIKMKLAGLEEKDLEILSKSIENLSIIASKII
jgi:DNA-binding MarR family transcriptional regulator